MDDEENFDGGAVAAKPSGGNRKMMGLVVFLLIVLIGVIAVAAFFIMGALGNDSTNQSVIDLPAVTSSPEDVTHVGLGSSINTNLLTGPDGRDTMVHFNFTVAVNNTLSDSDDVISILRSSEPIVRSIALNILRDMTVSELNVRGGDTLLANELLRRLQDEFRTNLITDINIIDLATH